MHEIKWMLVGALITFVINEIAFVIEERKKKKSYLKVAAATSLPPAVEKAPPPPARTPEEIDRDYIDIMEKVVQTRKEWVEAHMGLERSASLIDYQERKEEANRLWAEHVEAERIAKKLRREFEEAIKHVESS